MNADERETTVNATDGDTTVRIWSAQRRAITAMRKHPSFTQIRTGTHDGSVWAEFTIPADQWNVTRGAKRKGTPLSPDQREAAAARLRSVKPSGAAREGSDPAARG